MPKPYIISVVGKSNSGKTTLIEKLIKEIKKRGYKIGIIKHSLHGFNMDKSGKDSFKHSAAGADTVMAASPYRIGIVKRVTSDDPDELKKYFQDVDIVVTEGYKKAGKPKIEIFRQEIHKVPLCIKDNTLFAFVTNADIKVNVPKFKTSEIEKLTDLIEERFLKQRT
ncbi:MAG: molybdopterin-guanine dinucleotide biosynthesis protein B [Deltaproteobacteria bacterium]|nr:molybdopterin-guanine dinucleotide biosynthesis protein B [Deltaproteobacteria bacterium]